MAKDIEAFERVFRETGKLQHARLAYGDSDPVSRKGMQGLNKTLRAIVERVRAEETPRSPIMVMPPIPKSEPVERPLTTLPAAMVATQFKPGQTGNPNGGSLARTFRTAAKRKLDREGAEKYVDVLGEIVENGKHDSDRVRAFETFRDTAGEKPVQGHQHVGVFVLLPPPESVMSEAFDCIDPGGPE